MIRRTPRVVVMIPARYDSSRYPGKPLVPLRGCTGEPKPLIRRSWEAAMRVEGVHEVYVVTDHDTIAETARGFGAQVVMTSADCRNGTERCAEALDRLGEVPDLVVNLQGDAPLTPPHFVTALIDSLSEAEEASVATLAIRCDAGHYAALRTDELAGRVGGTTVVTDSRQRAFYFSKRLIPWFPASRDSGRETPVRLHLGVYAYTPDALAAYRAEPPFELERLEGLEQLRFLELGLPIQVVEVQPPEWEIWELNNPSDVEPVERGLALAGIA